MDRVDYQQGDAVPTRPTLEHAQNAVLGAFRTILASYTTQSHAFKIQGAVVSENLVVDTVTVSVTAGYVSFNGEPFEVEAHSLDRAVAEVAWLAPHEEFIDNTPTNNAQGVGRNVKVKRTMKLYKGTVLPAVADFMPLQAPTQLELTLQQLSGRIMPVGSMFIYTGSMDNFDGTGLGLPNTPAQGLAICNGVNGTIDMRGLAAVGAINNVPASGAPVLQPNVNANYSVGDVFGEETHELTEAELPEVTVQYEQPNVVANDADLSGDANPNNRGTTSTDITFGGGESHENRQPSRALVWVQVVA